ncbi:alpha/beta fold hydrolase [Sediminicurvatus halobius]|uniref:Alpha/beta hydrolase n=1 Tax=Sediminicurvatus halobius TaxID=2182432 RepID=A0A2U2MW92_9GAMM|nr:alpha/beta hydrolase [Spiribacter halobius]PWG61137.1 alpha/beta hydrolase [Spiribacter halobius]UEX77703.1 alpha/beta hydrolase [Spiribacter halobius]
MAQQLPNPRDIVPRDAVINGHRIAYGLRGEGRHLVFLHGTPSSSFIWRDVLEHLGVGARTLTFDLLGFGHSERPWQPSVDTSVAAQVPVLFSLLDQVGFADAHLVAHDIGGAVAMRAALASPQRFRTLTLIDTVSFDSWPSPRTRQQIAQGLDALLATDENTHREHFRAWLASAVHDEQRFRAGALETYLDMISGPVGQASLIQHQIRHYDSRYTEELTPRLAELGELPTQLIWGREDAWQRLEWGERLHAAIPGSELHVLDACGHFAMEDRGNEVASLIEGFTSRHAAPEARGSHDGHVL